MFFLGLLTWRQIGHGQEPINQTDSNIDVEFLGQIIVASLRRHEMQPVRTAASHHPLEL